MNTHMFFIILIVAIELSTLSCSKDNTIESSDADYSDSSQNPVSDSNSDSDSGFDRGLNVDSDSDLNSDLNINPDTDSESETDPMAIDDFDIDDSLEEISQSEFLEVICKKVSKCNPERKGTE